MACERREDGRDTRWREGEGARGPWASEVPSELRGLMVTVSGKWANPWGAPEDLILEVHPEDGRTRLLWNHELEGVTKRA